MPFQFSPLSKRLSSLLGHTDHAKVPVEERIYANQDLKMSHIKLVGFDMDYTLAEYRKAPMEQLQYDMTVECMIRDCGYPEEIRELKYNSQDVTRGLTIDKRYGHLFKMDAYGRVTRCYHGHTPLSIGEIQNIYRKAIIKISTEDFSSLDTLFALPEASLYMNLVDFYKKRHETGASVHPLVLPLHHETPNQTRINTFKLANDVRHAIDTIHKDGSLKTKLMSDLATYVRVDERLPLTLHKMRSAGKRLFLLTNSHWPYTDALMSFMLNDRLAAYPNWRRYFDYVIVGGRKPVFFTDRDPFLVLDTSEPGRVRSSVFEGETLERHDVYQAGNMRSFEEMTISLVILCEAAKTVSGAHV